MLGACVAACVATLLIVNGDLRQLRLEDCISCGSALLVGEPEPDIQVRGAWWIPVVTEDPQ